MAMPIAASSSPVIALGAVWWGMVGGGYPDWFDLRSDFSRRLKHRGTSHSLLLGAAFTFALWWVLGLVADQFGISGLTHGSIDTWAMAFGLGFLSHIVADACTRAGVQPFLPFSRLKVWILPMWLRGKSEGTPDTIGRVIAIAVIVASVSRFVSLQVSW